MEGHLEAIGGNVIVNRLEVPGVKREHLNSSYKCQASNTKLMMPVEKTVRLELLCKYMHNTNFSSVRGYELKPKRSCPVKVLKSLNLIYSSEASNRADPSKAEANGGERGIHYTV